MRMDGGVKSAVGSEAGYGRVRYNLIPWLEGRVLGESHV